MPDYESPITFINKSNSPIFVSYWITKLVGLAQNINIKLEPEQSETISPLVASIIIYDECFERICHVLSYTKHNNGHFRDENPDFRFTMDEYYNTIYIYNK